MTHGLVLTGLVVLLSANAMAATAVTAKPGFIGADSPLYDLDAALDAVLKPPGDAVHERASEALVAAKANDTAAALRAATRLGRVANRTNGVEAADGLQQAAQLLQEVKATVPATAVPGLETAIKQVTEARNRFPTDQQPGETGPATGPAQP